MISYKLSIYGVSRKEMPRFLSSFETSMPKFCLYIDAVSILGGLTISTVKTVLGKGD